jgi:hypothetical protein
MQDEALTQLIERGVAEARLPNYAATSVIAKYGDGAACDVCNRPGGYADVMYALRFGRGDGARPLLMHYRCFEFWESAIRRPVLRLVTAMPPASAACRLDHEDAVADPLRRAAASLRPRDVGHAFEIKRR